MKTCIVRPHYAGLFSLINNVVTCLSLYDKVQVDWSNGCIYGNAWPALFDSCNEPLPGAEVVSQYPHQALTYKNAGLLYQAETLLDWRSQVYLHWRKLTLRREIVDRAHNFIVNNLGGNYVAVLVRGTGHAGEQISDKAQTADEYRSALSACGNARAYVMAGDNESLLWFSGFNAISHPGTYRADTRDCQPHLTAPQTIEDAVQCMIEVIILSYATALIHPVSNMATAALYMNPALRSIYLR